MVRNDGQRLLNGTLPTLIERAGPHPTQSMPPSGIPLQSLRASHPHAALLAQAHRAIGWAQMGVAEDAANLLVTLHTPRGLITLESLGI